MIEEIFDYYIKYGEYDYIGEEISQISHMIQTAMLAENNNEPIHLILACLFHDIGHLLQIENKVNKVNKYGIKNHEKITKKFLSSHNIPEPIPSLAENHVKAKKYKTFKNPNYFNKLSNASKQTLMFQGGPMTEQEAIEFERDELFEESLRLREYDDKAKERGVELRELGYYKEMLRNYLNER
jgi:2-amino-1-hydroxyethylphosphonate dioxygenase (glycine-forming)